MLLISKGEAEIELKWLLYLEFWKYYERILVILLLDPSTFVKEEKRELSIYYTETRNFDHAFFMFSHNKYSHYTY